MRTARTGTPVWDVINGVTHFATHNNGIKITDSDRSALQMEAGRILSKSKFDVQNLIKSPF